MGRCGGATGGGCSCWGVKVYVVSATGSQAADDVSFAPRLVPAASELTTVTGSGRACGLTVSGRPFCWGMLPGFHIAGASDVAPTGASTTCGTTYYVYDGCLVPTPVSSSSFVVAMVASGGAQDCAVDTSGIAYCWGDNLDGAARGTAQGHRAPNAVIRQPEPRRSIVAGGAPSPALRAARRGCGRGDKLLSCVPA